MYNHTFDLRCRADKNGQIEFVFITELPYEQLAPVMKKMITYIARRQFAQDMEVDEKRWKFQMTDESKAITAALREDARNKRRNSLTDNAEIANFLTRVAGPNSYSGSTGFFPKRTTQ